MPRLSKIGAAALAAFGWTSGAAGVTASYLQVAGGGGGGRDIGGGGGAGGYLTGTTSLNITLSYTVTVGAGGAGSAVVTSRGANGSNSQIGALTASVGGGGGGSNDVAVYSGSTGGSGGGSSALSTTSPAGTAGQGNAGGAGNNNLASGGGGGAGAAGSAGSGTSASGNGGNGSASSISGSSVTYAGGGGGGGYVSSASVGTGGTGGGGAGVKTGTATSGTANLGGGGGGGGSTGGNGGSGVVIISYPSPQKFGGGIVTVSGSNTIHTFMTSGTLSPLSTLTANFLVVAGGGGGGYNFHTVTTGGGGGAGGYRTSSGLTIDTNSTYLVTVGAGGAGAPNTSTNGGAGTDSFFSTITSTGGGYGATNGQVGGNGGSGGGASGPNTPGSFAGGLGNTPSTSPSQGFDGGSATQFGGGGGGGSSAAGQIASLGGAGGAGTANSISGASVTYASGGGSNNAGGANVGDGGGRGTGGALNPGFAGGSGIVIISYAGSTQLMAGGTVTISGGNVIHTFTSSGYLTPLTLVGNSLRFRSSASAYLSRTPATTTNRKTYTWSAWVKRGQLGVFRPLFFSEPASNQGSGLNFNSNDTLQWYTFNNTVPEDYGNITTAVYRDPAAWYHVVLAIDTTQATASNRARIWINGVQQIFNQNYGDMPQNSDTFINVAGAPYYIGRETTLVGTTFDGYMTEIRFIDGQALTPNSFGTFNQFGVWQPIRYGGSYGTNGFYLPFSNNASTTTLGLDFSPQGNNWTTNNISVTAGSTYDSMTDVPTLTSTTAANYCVMNPLVTPPVGTISQANTLYERAAFGGVGRSLGARGTIGVSAGKFYFELGFVAEGSNGGTSGSSDDVFGVISIVAPADIGVDYNAYSLAWIYQGNGNKANGSSSAYGASLAQGDIIGVAIDMDSGKIWFSKNGTFQASGDPVAGTNAAFTNLAGNTLTPVVACYHNGLGSTRQRNMNCGQRPFAYTPPSGFLPLNTFNL